MNTNETVQNFYDDEDVIHPNSPLSNYIKDLNLSGDNFLADETEHRNNVTKYDKDSSSFETLNFKYYSSFLVRNVIEFIDSVYALFLSHIFILKYFAIKLNLESKATNLLIDEDKILINNWNSDNNNGSQSVIFTLWGTTSLCLFSICMIIFNFSNLQNDQTFIEKICDFNNIIYLYPSYLSIMILLFIVFELIQFLVIFYKLRTLLSDMKTLYLTIKKCIRLVQEAELIARGFTSASVRCLAEKIELSPNLPIASARRQYAELRKYIFSWAKSVFMEYRSSTSKLVDCISHDIEFDFTSHYLAKLDIKEFGVILQYDINLKSDYQELLTVTDNFSISSLRTVFDLMELQVSEFFKCLYLVTSIYSENDSSKSLVKENAFCKWHSQLYALCGKISSVQMNVSKIFKYYRCFEISHGSSSELKTPQYNDKSDIAVTIHNMSLHLKAALWRLIEIEDKFNNSCLIENIRENKSFAKEISSVLQVVRSEVSGCEEYLIKSFQFLDEITSDKTLPICSKIGEIEKTEAKHEPSITVSKIWDTENIIQDEVFEDVISRKIEEREEPSDKIFQQEDCQKHMKLLKELKNVLVVKADEHHAREKIALAKKQNDYEDTAFDYQSDKEDVLLPLKRNPEDEENLHCLTKNANDTGNVSDQTKQLFSVQNRSQTVEDEIKDMNNTTKYIADINSTDNFPEHESASDKVNFNKKLELLLGQRSSLQANFSSSSKDSFTSAIALMAAQHRQILGLTTEEFGCNSSEDSSVED